MLVKNLQILPKNLNNSLNPDPKMKKKNIKLKKPTTKCVLIISMSDVAGCTESSLC